MFNISIASDCGIAWLKSCSSALERLLTVRLRNPCQFAYQILAAGGGTILSNVTGFSGGSSMANGIHEVPKYEDQTL
jgi:hypothetical protein